QPVPIPSPAVFPARVERRARADELVVRLPPFGQLEQVRTQQLGDLKRTLRALRLAERHPQQASIVVEVADDAIGDLRCPKAKHQRGQGSDRADVPLIGQLQAEIDELAGLVDAELLLTALALANRLDAGNRVRADPLL